MSAASRDPARHVPPEAWTFASGRIAALEGQLLSAESLDRLAGAESPAAAAAALAESPLRAAAGAASAEEAARAVAGHYAALLDSLAASCPSGALIELLSLPARCRALKERARRELSADAASGAGGGLSPEAALRLLGDDFAADGHVADALRLAGAALADARPPAPGLALDLCLDSARLMEAPELAAELGDAGVTAHVSAETAVRSVLTVWRARLLAEGGAAPELAAWLPRLFLRGALAEAMAGRLWAKPLSAWAALLGEELDPRLGAETFGAGEPASLGGWEKAAFDWLSAGARELRRQTFGAGRVRGFAWALEVEARNVRLALVGRRRGVGPAAIRGLLWEGAA
jgi:hypothetical protein